MQNPNQPKSSTSAMEKMATALALTGAGLVTFFSGPVAYRLTVGGVEAFAQTNYGPVAGVVPAAWWCVTYFLIGTFSAVLLKLAVSSSSVAFVRRFIRN